MSEQDPRPFLAHIIESVGWIEEAVQGMDVQQFSAHVPTQDIVARRLEIIGEATRNLSKAFRDQHSEIPWKEMAGMRDVLIHQYFGMDPAIVWDTIAHDIPKLKTRIIKLRAELDDADAGNTM